MPRDYVTHYLAQLPSGAVWPRDPATESVAFVRGLTKEFARIDDRAAQLLLEMDPRTTTELIDDWERVTGLPDPHLDAVPTTLDGRRAAVTARLVGRGSTAGPGVDFLLSQIR